MFFSSSAFHKETRESKKEWKQEPTTNSTHMSDITLPLFVLVKRRDSWFIEERNSFLAHINPSGPNFLYLAYLDGLIKALHAKKSSLYEKCE